MRSYLLYFFTAGRDYDALFAAAAARWEQVIISDVQDLPAGSVTDWFDGEFTGAYGSSAAYDGAVDDLVRVLRSVCN